MVEEGSEGRRERRGGEGIGREEYGDEGEVMAMAEGWEKGGRG